jgi:hypothetical protein
MRACLAIAASFLALAACQKPTEQPKTPVTSGVVAASPSPTPSQHASATPAEPLDPFLVAIDAERWNVLLDRGIDATREGDGAKATPLDENDALRADLAVHDAVAKLLLLRNALCARGLAKDKTCALAPLPAWVTEPPSAATPLQEIDNRIQWVGITMSELQDIGCEYGRKVSKDQQYCDVE